MKRTMLGRKYGQLTVVENLGDQKYRCLCDCGNETVGSYKSLTEGHKKSCGCLRESRRTIMPRYEDSKPVRSHPMFEQWRGMLRRCYDLKHHKYQHYGARGITVCDRWKNDFWAFVADVGKRPDGMTLERKDNNGPYSPENTKWASQREQNWNQRTTTFVSVSGVILPISVAERYLGLNDKVTKKAASLQPAERIAYRLACKALSRAADKGRRINWTVDPERLIPKIMAKFELENPDLEKIPKGYE